MARGRFISYLRVSTGKQGSSGLGLEAQRKAVDDYLNGGRWTLVAEFVEVESGTKKGKRPKLQEALRMCRLHGAKLVIAKMDRLARNVAFISNLMESGADFVAVDFPQANRLTVHILAAVAEHEAEAISIRIREALAAAKARGKKLGTPGNLRNHDLGRALGRATKTERARTHAADLKPVIDDLRASGALSLRALAHGLNARGIPAAAGGSWSAVQVKRVLERAEARDDRHAN